MYCSVCGAAVAKALTYCNHCGAKLNGAKSDGATKQADSFMESLIWAIVAVFVVGMGTIIGLMAVMKDLLNFGNNIILAVMSLCFLLMIAIEGTLIGMLLRRKSEAKEAGDAKRLNVPTTKELDAAHPLSLPDPVPSVTEQTTRSFEPIHRERKSK